MKRIHVALFGLITLMTLLYLARTQVHGDIAAIANLADGIADGEIPHRDYWDTNPPLFAYLNVPAVWLGRVLHVAYPYTVYLLMGLVAGLSLTLIFLLMGHLPGEREGRSEWVLLCAFLILQFPLYHFAQREHLTVALILPYLFLLTHRLSAPEPVGISRAFLVAIGGLAGVGFCIKPYFVLAWIVAEAGLRSGPNHRVSLRRDENLGVLGVFFGYSLFLLWEQNFISAIPRIYALYATYREPWKEVLVAPFLNQGPLSLSPHWILLLSTLVVAIERYRNRGVVGWRANVVYLAVAWSFFVVMAIQAKNFDYHFYPFHVFGLLAIASSLPRSVGPAVAFAAGLLFIWPDVRPSLRHLGEVKKISDLTEMALQPRVQAVAKTIERFTRPGDYVGFFDYHPFPLQIALAVTRRKSAQPGPDNWPFHGNYSRRSNLVGLSDHLGVIRIVPFSVQSPYPEWERQFFYLTAQKWIKTKPPLLFLRRYPMDLEYYFTSVPSLREFFKDYRRVTRLNVGKEFDVYARMAAR